MEYLTLEKINKDGSTSSTTLEEGVAKRVLKTRKNFREVGASNVPDPVKPVEPVKEPEPPILPVDEVKETEQPGDGFQEEPTDEPDKEKITEGFDLEELKKKGLDELKAIYKEAVGHPAHHTWSPEKIISKLVTL